MVNQTFMGTLGMTFKRLSSKWNNSAASNFQSNHLHSLPWIQATCLLFSFLSWERKSGEDRTDGSELFLEEDFAGQFLHQYSQALFGSPGMGEADVTDHFRPPGSLRQFWKFQYLWLKKGEMMKGNDNPQAGHLTSKRNRTHLPFSS